MHRAISAFVLVLASTLPRHTAQAAVVATDMLVMPLAPDAPRNRFNLSSSAPLDPGKPVWVSYQVLAVTADDEPQGSIMLDAALEGVPVALPDMKLVFDAHDMRRTSSAGTIGQQLAAQVGQRTPAELAQLFGPELYAAYEALNQKRGAILEGAIVKTYGPTGSTEATLLASIDFARGIQPMMVAVAMGQGEVPAQYQQVAAAASGGGMLKTFAGLGALLMLAYFWLRRRA